LTAGAFATMLASGVLQVPVPATLADGTVQAAVALAAGQVGQAALVSPAVRSLVDSALATRRTSHWQVVLGVALAALIALVGTATLVRAGLIADPFAPSPTNGCSSGNGQPSTPEPGNRKDKARSEGNPRTAPVIDQRRAIRRGRA
jgi:hypothetical protein